MVPSLPLLSCELSVSVKENPDRKKNIQKSASVSCKDCGIYTGISDFLTYHSVELIPFQQFYAM